MSAASKTLIDWIARRFRGPRVRSVAEPSKSMRRDERRIIIAEYGEALERYADLVWGAPERLLPHPRERIEEALREEFLATSNEEERNWLEVASCILPLFFPILMDQLRWALARR